MMDLSHRGTLLDMMIRLCEQLKAAQLRQLGTYRRRNNTLQKPNLIPERYELWFRFFDCHVRCVADFIANQGKNCPTLVRSLDLLPPDTLVVVRDALPKSVRQHVRRRLEIPLAPDSAFDPGHEPQPYIDRLKYCANFVLIGEAELLRCAICRLLSKSRLKDGGGILPAIWEHHRNLHARCAAMTPYLDRNAKYQTGEFAQLLDSLATAGSVAHATINVLLQGTEIGPFCSSVPAVGSLIFEQLRAMHDEIAVLLGSFDLLNQVECLEQWAAGN